MTCKYSVEKRISKNNKEYYVLVLEFKNGYKAELFITAEQAFIINQNN